MTNTNNQRQDKDEKYLKPSINLLFSKHIEHEPTHDLNIIERYYRYLADRIDSNKLQINADQELLEAFESVSLLLKERLLLYPDAISHQISQIFEEEKLLQSFSIISNIPQSDLKRIILRSSILDSLSMFFSIIRKDFILSRNYRLTPRILFNIKIGLKRISQIIKYAATIHFLDYDTTFHEYKDHYDPNLISKHKINALINLLKLQLENIPDRETAKRIEKKIEKIEEEIRKPKPRWGIIIVGFFILFGFLADIKTVHPTIYSRPYAIVKEIIATIHIDGLVQEARYLLQFENKGADNHQDDSKKILPPKDVILPKREDESIDEG